MRFRSVLPRVVFGAAGKTRFQKLADLAEHDRWTPDQLNDHSRRALGSLLRHAAVASPYYAEVIQATGLNPASADPNELLGRLPILTKAVLRSRLGDLVDRRVDRRMLYHTASGGSTGEPVEFYQDRSFRELSTASRLRGWGWSGFCPGDRSAWIWGAPQETGPARSLAGRAISFVDNRRLYDAFQASPAAMRGWATDLRAFQPRYIVGYASALASFSRLVLAERWTPPGTIEAVFSTAEQLLPQQRAVIAQAFGAPVRDQYGCREIQTIASECPAGKMHLATDVVHVEFLPSDSETNLSRIIATPLFAFGMPMLRYDLGDLGTPASETCDCGLPYPLMRIGVGRTSDVFVTAEGGLVHGEYFTHLLYGLPGVSRFQFEQLSPKLVRLRVVPEPGFGEATRAQLDEVRRRIQRDVSPTLQVEWEATSEIPVTATGKFRFTVSRFGAQALLDKKS